MRVVIDTNVLFSAFYRGGKPQQLLNFCLNQGEILSSTQTFAELTDKIRTKLEGRVAKIQIETFLVKMGRLVTFLAVEDKLVPSCPDLKDHKFLNLALAGEADFIISGDRHLLNMKCYQGIPIVKPAEFLDLHAQISP